MRLTARRPPMKNKPDKHKLTTLYTNIDNSLLSKIDELKLRISHENPDITCLSEIKPKNGLIPSRPYSELQLLWNRLTSSWGPHLNVDPLTISESKMFHG